MQADPFSAPPNTGPAAPEERDAAGDRHPCSSCGRKFVEEALVKHEKICQKVFQQKRKAFDAKEARKAEGMNEFD